MELTPGALERFFGVVLPHLDERQRRVVAEALGRGGKTAVARASGLSRNTVIKAAGEVGASVEPSARLRAPGGGDKPAVDELVHPETRGNPTSLLRWTSKSTTKLADELRRSGFRISADTVGRLLQRLGYSSQVPSKQNQGTRHPDRDAQFRYLNDAAAAFAADGEPVVSVDTKKVDTKKKELVGNHADGGREWRPAGEAERVNLHDFVDPELGRAVPCGVYDLAHDEGWVSVGDDGDTAAFAVEALRRWWRAMGAPRFPGATRLLVTADAGGSNGYRVRAWKTELAKLAAETGLAITVCHYPPGTSKWNKTEHRLFSFVTTNRRGRPLTTYRTIVELIGATTTTKGLRVRAERDTA